MRVGVVSDAHGNIDALNAALSAMGEVDELIFAGDFLGYYFEPAAVVRCLRDRNARCVLGNHDVFFLAHNGLIESPIDVPTAAAYRAKYGPGLDIAGRELDTESLEWMATLSASAAIELGGTRILVAHGSPWRPINEYIYPDDRDFERFAQLEVDLVIMGHTHYPLVRRVGSTCLLNPGSCGQPRDGDSRASFAVVDIDGWSLECSIRRVPYEVDSLIARCLDLAPSVPLLVDMLTRDRKATPVVEVVEP